LIWNKIRASTASTPQAARRLPAPGKVRLDKSDAPVAGFTIHPNVSRPKAQELILGIAHAATFGRVTLFGRGGDPDAFHTTFPQGNDRRSEITTDLYLETNPYTNQLFTHRFS
jgi:hypothetical protein